MSEKDTGGPAFPCDQIVQRNEKGHLYGPEISTAGMTLRQYAAIKLRVPDSGTDWLDEMIRTGQRDEFAAKAMQGLLSNGYIAERYPMPAQEIAAESYMIAGQMLEVRNDKD